MEIANEPLINQARQTIEMHSEGLEIAENWGGKGKANKEVATLPDTMIRDDDFDMIEDDIDIMSPDDDLGW